MVTVNILDASALITKEIPDGHNITVEEVHEEVRDKESRLEMNLNSIQVERAKNDYLEKIDKVAEQTGDIHKLSNPDKKLLALALEYKEKNEDVRVISDDYAIQNTSQELGINYKGVRQKEIDQKITWKKICRGCKREVKKEFDECPYCGSELKLVSDRENHLH